MIYLDILEYLFVHSLISLDFVSFSYTLRYTFSNEKDIFKDISFSYSYDVLGY